MIFDYLTKSPLLTAVVSLMLVSLVLTEQRFEHGEKCTLVDNWCNYGKWLWCRKGQCQCLHPGRQIFDAIRDRCVGIVGKECNVYIGERDCINNAYCHFDDGHGSCRCKEGFISSHNTCISLSGSATTENLVGVEKNPHFEYLHTTTPGFNTPSSLKFLSSRFRSDVSKIKPFRF